MAFYPHRLNDSTVCQRAFLNELYQIESEPWINEQIKTEHSSAALMFNPFGSGLENVALGYIR